MSLPRTPDRGCAVDDDGNLKAASDISWDHSPSHADARSLTALSRKEASPSQDTVARRTRAKSGNKTAVAKKKNSSPVKEGKRKRKQAAMQEELKACDVNEDEEMSSDEENTLMLKKLEAFDQADRDQAIRTKSSKTDDIRLIFEREDRVVNNERVKGHICTICRQNPKETKTWYTGGNSTLRSHISRFDSHYVRYLQLCEEQDITPHPRALPDKPSGPLQSSLDSIVKRNPIYTPQRLLHHLIELVVSDDQAFRLLEKMSFRKLLLFMRPSTREGDIPHRTKIKEEVIEKAREVVFDLKSKFKEVKGLISFTFDSWTSRAGDPYLAVTAHWVSHPPNQPNNWILENALIAFSFISGNHGGDNIAKILTRAIDRFDLRGKIGWFTSDNASVNDTTMVSLKNPGMAAEDVIGFKAVDRRVRCAAHVLNLAARAFIEGIAPTPASVIRKKLMGMRRKHRSIYDDDSGVDDEFPEEDETPFGTGDDSKSESEEFDASDLLGKVLALIHQIRASPQATAYFEECCTNRSIKPRKLKKWVRTRWSSMYDLLVRLREVQPAIDRFVTRADIAKQVPKLMEGRTYKMFAITADEWEHIEVITRVLQGPAEAQNIFSSEQLPTVWRTVPALEFLQTKWEAYLLSNEYSSVKPGLLRGLAILKKYYLLTDDTSVNLVCLVLNPMFKLEYIKSKWDAAWINRARKTMKQVVEAYQQQDLDDDMILDTPCDVPAPLRSKGGFGSAWILDAIRQASTVAIVEKKLELDKYLDSPPEIIEDQEILLWWGCHSQEYPILSRIARDYFAIQGSSVASERSFSSGGLTGTDRRNRLNHKTFEALQILKSAYRNKVVEAPVDNEDIDDETDILAIPPRGKL